MRFGLLAGLIGALGMGAFAQTTPGVGSGAPTPGVTFAFTAAWASNGFNRLVGDPTDNVSKFGSAGLIQHFPSAANSAATLALVKPDTTETFNVRQVLATMYSYYNSVGVGNAGYPTIDTATCPVLKSSPANSCVYQLFTNDYALFVYTQSVGGTQNFAIRDPYYTKWNTFGGLAVLGPANSVETAATSVYGSQATWQTYDQGAIYNITAGSFTGRLLAIKEPVYDVYVANGAAAGSLGLPQTEELVLPNGYVQQTFEGGAIQYNPATGIAVLEPPIASVRISPSGSVLMKLGDSLIVQATVFSTTGVALTDRNISWNTSNGQVVQIQPAGLSATLKAVGAGLATVTASAAGKTSPALVISVTAPCCQIGEGAPTAVIQAAFQSAVTRNHLSIQLPATAEVVRAGNGYVQQLVSASAPPISYLVAVADGSAAGYVVDGPILTKYLALGGPASSLGFPISDPTAGVRQIFQHGALAGTPIQLVTGAILAKWATLGYETGTAGSPTAPATTFQTFLGSTGNMQAFQTALIVAPTTGAPTAGAFTVAGPILLQYNTSGGPAGNLGAPTDDQHNVNGLNQQDFEGGYINYAPGTSTANVVATPRQPAVIATPAAVTAGNAVHLVAGGFANGATVRVSQTGRPDFIVTVGSGSYAWDVWVPASASSATVTVKAADVNSAATAQVSYNIRSASSVALSISVSSGDQQDGAPGAVLLQPLVVSVKDQSGNPATGQTVTFAASPGAQVVPASATTDANGQASTTLRLPGTSGIALATAQSGHVVVTFSARAGAISLTNFPALSQAVDGMLGNGPDTIRQKGALLASVASIIRYYQLRNELTEPNGLADPSTLNQFLKSFCTFDGQGNQICDGFITLGSSTEQTVNFWRVGAFAASSVSVSIEPVSLDSVRDLVAAGSPVLLALSLAGGGSHFVVATGIAADSSVLIADPNPSFAQTNLNGYLNGFSAGGTTVQAVISGVVRLLPHAPPSPGFLVASNVLPAISSLSGVCGPVLQFPATAAVAGTTLAAKPANLYFYPCGSTLGSYQLDVGSPSNTIFTDLSANGARVVLNGSATSSLIVQSGSQWSLAPVATNFATTGVVNAANPAAGLAPGSLISIYGSGLAANSGATTLQVNGEAAPVLAAFPFLVNAQIPLDVVPGSVTLRLTSTTGSAQQSIIVSTVAPAIFSITSTQAAVTNLDYALNTPSNPVSRGGTLVVYGTGFGAVSAAGNVSTALTPVTATIGGIQVPVAFAGPTPGVPGLYQANVTVPASLPPGLALPLSLVQAGVASNTVSVAIQ